MPNGTEKARRVDEDNHDMIANEKEPAGGDGRTLEDRRKREELFVMYCNSLKDHTEEEYLCAYCQEYDAPYRHNTPTCYRFANARRKKQWDLVAKHSLCERCLIQKPSDALEDVCPCPTDAPELCQECPVSHQAKLQCRPQPSSDEPTATVLTTKSSEQQDISHASDTNTSQDDPLMCLHCYD